MKVASVIASVARRTGGPIVNLLESLPYLRDAGIEVTIYATDMGGPASAGLTRIPQEERNAIARSELPIKIFEAKPPWRLAYSPSLGAALRRDIEQFDVVRVHGVYLYPNYAAASVARGAGVPYVVTPHGALDPWLRRHGRHRKTITNLLWQNRMLRRASAIHVATECERELVADVAPAEVPRFVVGNGVAASRFTALPPKGAFRRDAGIPADVPLILCLGRVSHKKGIDVLIETLSQMRTATTFLAIVGPDDEDLTPSLRALAHRFGIQNRVVFCGPRFGSSQLEALADADVWALPSHTENFGNAIVEAMAAGLPVVISDQVNLAREASAQSAAIVAPVDAPAFAAACDMVLKMDDHDRSRLQEAARAFASTFDWPVTATRLASMLSHVAQQPRQGER